MGLSIERSKRDRRYDPPGGDPMGIETHDDVPSMLERDQMTFVRHPVTSSTTFGS